MEIRDITKHILISEDWVVEWRSGDYYKIGHLYLIGVAQNDKKLDLCLACPMVIKKDEYKKKNIIKMEKALKEMMLHTIEDKLEESLKTRQGYMRYRGYFRIKRFELNERAHKEEK